MNAALIIQILIGAGVLGLLWKIQRELGGISSVMSMLKEGQDDHETRIRAIEQSPRRRDYPSDRPE